MLRRLHGGLPAWRDNAALLDAAGHTVYLRRTAEQIARRLSPYGRRKRPKLAGLSDGELVEFMRRDMALREPLYARARTVIDCEGRTDEELVETIVKEVSDGE